MLTLIKNATLVNEGNSYKSDVLIENHRIKKIAAEISINADKIINADALHLLPGVIDDQVHFREPGLTHKATIYSESKAAVAGGITSYMEMPNTNPQALTQKLLEEKYQLAAKKSIANYSFFMGVSNDNLEEVLKTNPKNVGAIKIFMGSSTGNMLVDNKNILEEIFAKSPMLIAVHCEDETTIQKNINKAREKYGDQVPISEHPKIRSTEACYKSSSIAVALAKKHNSRLHVFHVSTKKELELFDNTISLKDKKITAEVCIHHLWYDEKDYLFGAYKEISLYASAHYKFDKNDGFCFLKNEFEQNGRKDIFQKFIQNYGMHANELNNFLSILRNYKPLKKIELFTKMKDVLLAVIADKKGH